ncbi:MAG TPA: NAD(P)/FAD-dependent oxidoreductase [Mycobacteriales bacterium]|jgi:cation diffusion facilitator CzcD-associated flavoprotein CzcO|nr:NAD(P)/FAD-dependent oxidoreductase [Mycobacteriales bacterium]
MTRETQTLVIGASAAGLATAAELRRHGQRFALIESRDQVAGAWRRHYDRLHLHTPKSSSALPGLPMPKAWARYPSRDQVVEYLEQYQQHFDLRPHFGERVTRVERVAGGWETTTSAGSWHSRQVVVASGRTAVPVRPTWPGMTDYKGAVLHSSEYDNGDCWKGKSVLIVGFGNSACEQALDLVERGAKAHLSVRSPVNVVPRDVLGLIPVLQLGIVMRYLPTKVADAMAWPMIATTVGDVRKLGLRKLPYGPNTQIAKDRHVPLLDIGTIDQIKAGNITVHGDIERFTENGVVFSDGAALDVAAVVLATGYRAGVDAFVVEWDSVCDATGFPLRSGRRSGLDGLYFCGMYVSPAGMLREIGIEARRIAADIAGVE